MAELDAQLRLDIDQALRDINQLEGALDRALASVDLRLDTTSAQRQFDDLARTADQALSDVDIDFDTGSVGRLNSELNGVERSLEEADREAGQLDNSLRGAARAADDANTSTGGLARSFSGIGKALGGVGVAAAAFVAIRGAIGFAIDAKNAFAELQDSANAVKVVFGDAVGTIEAFGESVAQSAGLSTAEFNQAASVLGSALLNVGFSADIAATKTVELTQRAADMASIFGGPVGDALGAIQSALRGETDPIERFGVSLSEAAVNAQAAALGFQSVAGEFSTSEKAAARLDLIMQQTARTSGDFANTSDDLANAQKVLAAEFENAKASLGEALLPVFQTLLDIAPEVITSLEQFAPSLQAFAVSVGNLLQHREGALDLLDILNGFADLPRAFGEIGSAVSAIGDGFSTLGQTVAGIFTGPFGGTTAQEAWAAGMERAAQRGQESIERINTQGLVDDLREGADAASALASRLVQVGLEGQLNPKFIKDLTTIAGTDLRETAAALQTILNLGKTTGLTAIELRAIAVALAQINSAGESSEADRIQARLDLLNGVAPRAATALEILSGAAAEAGVELAEFALSADPAAQAMFDALNPADQLAIKLEAVRSGATTLTEVFGTNLTPAIFDASQALVDFDKSGKVTLDEFIRGLQEGVTETISFKANLQTLFDINPEIIPILNSIPLEEAIRLAQDLVSDPTEIPLVIAASKDVQGIAALQKEAILKVIELVRTGMPEQDISDFITLQTDPTTGIGPEFADALFSAWEFAKGSRELIGPDFEPVLVKSLEEAQTSALQTAAQDTVGFAFEGVDVTDAGFDLGFSFMGAVIAGIAGQEGKLQQVIVNTLDGAIQRQSPPKLFLDAGVDSGEAFWSGFQQADLQLKVPTPAFSGSIATGSSQTAAGVGGGGGDVIFNLASLDTRDADTTIARAGQIGGQVVGILNGRFHL